MISMTGCRRWGSGTATISWGWRGGSWNLFADTRSERGTGIISLTWFGGCFSKDFGLFCAGVVRSLGICLEWLSKRFGLLGCVLRRCAVAWGWNRFCRRPELRRKNFDKVGWKGTHGPSISIQSANPPRPIAGIETLNQVALYETQITLGLYP